ncbi:MAG: alpha/beta hydrolase-fold protein [Verrucomicrobia bacterium]|nr:alpha/beta hydrolase-fold protein [Verrucomicrobiota bacterium]
MRLVLLLALTFLARTVAAERITYAEVHSSALGRSLPVAVVAPATPRSGPNPVLFILHGRGRNHRSLLDAPAAREALLAASCYVVLPQGEDGWYINSPTNPAARYETYLEEVIAWADRHLPITRDATGRGLAGWSMGGYGAVRFAETHPGKFGFVASVIGLLDFPRPETLPEGQNYRVPTVRFTGDPAVWATLNPLHAVESLRSSALALVLASTGFERTMNERFIAELAAKKLPVRVHRLEGGHEFSLVERALPLVLADAANFFHNQPAATPSPHETSPRPQ